MIWREGLSMAQGPVNSARASQVKGARASQWREGQSLRRKGQSMAQGPGLRRKGRPMERKTTGGNNVTTSIVHMLPSNYSRLRTIE